MPIDRKCPTCRKPFPLEAQHRFGPFCSERCRTQDLGHWLNEAYRIPTRTQDDDEDGETTDQAVPRSDD